MDKGGKVGDFKLALSSRAPLTAPFAVRMKVCTKRRIQGVGL